MAATSPIYMQLSLPSDFKTSQWNENHTLFDEMKHVLLFIFKILD